MSDCSRFCWSFAKGLARSSLLEKEKLKTTGNHVILL